MMECGQLSMEKNALKTTQDLPKNIEQLIRYSNINKLAKTSAGSIPAASTNI